MTAVDFDDEPILVTVEIDHVRTNGLLPSELGVK
jgi:hypothetical protein